MSKKNTKDRCPQYRESPLSKSPRVLQNPDSDDEGFPAWQFSLFDKEHSLWGWGVFKNNVEEVLCFLSSLESMTWHKIKQQSGGRGHKGGTNHHTVQVVELTKPARDRLRELKLDEHSELFSLRANNRTRIYGIRNNKIIKVLWYDEYHGDNSQAVYPTKSR